MGTLTSRVEPSGRIMIPAVVRKKLGIEPGTKLIIEEEDGVILIHTRESALRKVQAYFAKRNDQTSWSDKLIAERRREVERENQR